MDIDDMGRINVKEGENVEIYNENGHVIATVRKSTHHPGLAFMPSSFYSNMLADEEGNIRANVSRTEEKTVDLKGLMGGFVRIE
jgi:formylmethanofuran dehydrogenase subunit D